MKYLLDTDYISFLQNKRGPEYAALRTRMAQHSPADFAFSIVSFHEQILGGHALLNRARTTAGLIRGYVFLLEIHQSYTTAPILPFDVAAAAGFRWATSAAHSCGHNGPANRCYRFGPESNFTHTQYA